MGGYVNWVFENFYWWIVGGCLFERYCLYCLCIGVLEYFFCVERLCGLDKNGVGICWWNWDCYYFVDFEIVGIFEWDWIGLLVL